MFKEEPFEIRPGTIITGQTYYISGEEDLVGILYGHFAPFTGPNGHGRMITSLQEIGCKKFVIAIPKSKKEKALDLDRELFTPEQRHKIIEKYLELENLEGACIFVAPTHPTEQIKRIARECIKVFDDLNIRPVFAVGEDRIDLTNDFIEFDTVEPDPNERAVLEYLYLSERGEHKTSGTKVRQLLLNDELEEFCKITGYPEEMFTFMQNLIKENEY